MQLLPVLLLLYQINAIASIRCDVEPENKEAILRKKLFCGDYDKSQRPVKEHTTSVNVTMHMVLQNYDFDDYLQKLFINVWLVLTWQDQHLTWDQKEYSDINELIIDSDDIWQPDMMPYSAYYSNNIDSSCTFPNCMLSNNGTIKCVPACEYHALCMSDFKNWPFDRQNCTLRFGMWAEHAHEVDFVEDDISLSADNAEKHNEWKILSAKVLKHAAILETGYSTNKTYPSVIFSYILERHSGAHCAVILTPAIVMIAVNLISLWLNCCSLQRLILLSSNVYLHFFMIQSLYWQIPYNGSAVPTFLIFFRDSLILSTSLLVLTVFIKHYYLVEKEASPALSTVVTTLTNNRVALWIFGVSNMSPLSDEDAVENNRHVEGSLEDNASDTAVLVGEPTPKKGSGKSDVFKVFAIIFDRVLFITIPILYILMLITLIPRYRD